MTLQVEVEPSEGVSHVGPYTGRGEDVNEDVIVEDGMGIMNGDSATTRIKLVAYTYTYNNRFSAVQRNGCGLGVTNPSRFKKKRKQ